jgi:single stranded DNA-binding protein
MSYMNITIIGRVGKNPEVRMTQNGKQITSCSVASGPKGRTMWFNVAAFDAMGKWMIDAEKGDQIYVSGTLEINTYERKDGKTAVDPKILANAIRVFKKGEKAEVVERQASPVQADFESDIPF